MIAGRVLRRAHSPQSRRDLGVTVREPAVQSEGPLFAADPTAQSGPPDASRRNATLYQAPAYASRLSTERMMAL